MRMLLKLGDRARGIAGVTLIELLVASVMVALLAGAMLVAFLTSARMSSQSTQHTEAASLLQQTLERFRNQVACDNNADVPNATPLSTVKHWFEPNCLSSADFTADDLPLPSDYTQRDYTVQAANCDGIPGPDCFKVEAHVHWNPPQ